MQQEENSPLLPRHVLVSQTWVFSFLTPIALQHPPSFLIHSLNHVSLSYMYSAFSASLSAVATHSSRGAQSHHLLRLPTAVDQHHHLHLT
jgi:hypothetical protein